MVSGQEESTERLTGAYVAGSGRAHLNIGSAKKRVEHTQLFGCPMVGTFNILLAPGSRIGGKPFLRHGADSYHLVRLRKAGREVYAYAVRWKGSKMSDDRIELLSKHPIPDHFKTCMLDIFVYERWSPERIEAWQDALGDTTKWQGHGFWQPQRADSALVWNHMRTGYDYSGKTVLDIGCNAGYFSFRAAQRGAIVTGVEKNRAILPVAHTIQHHIEMTDVEFRRAPPSVIPFSGYYDFIFYLSVHHQFDKDYLDLSRTIRVLKKQCGTLFVELINPPLGGGLSKEQVDAVALESGGPQRGKILAHYRHGVRGMRSLYVL